MQTRATARVQITIEVDGGSTWGGDCSLDQLYKQAAETARNTLLQAFKPGEIGRVRIVGDPKVTGVVVEKE